MDCQGCGEKNRDTARFCMACGAALALRCAVCDIELIAGSNFCDSCGTPVAAAVEPAAPTRKVVTVMFTDLTGSTALEENMDPETTRSVLERFYGSMRTEAERHGGRLVKFTGDGAMVVFGIPDVKEDDAERAVDTALAMRHECESLADELGLPLALKIGVNTGEVVVSETDEDVVGDCVNVAARLESAATAGEILVGAETWRLTRGTSRYAPIAPLTLKGKAEPVPAYRLLAVDERTTEAAAAPFVGRDAELARLIAAFDDAVSSNSARLVTIIGSPGLGKTRLARELMSALEERAVVREARCDPAGSTFAPIAEVIWDAVAVGEEANEDTVVSAVADIIPDDVEDRDRIATRVAAVLGAGQPGSTEETFWALRRLIETVARSSPVVLVLDDVHWGEPLLLDLIEHLAEWIRDEPVLLIVTGRPELRDLRPSLTEGGRASAVIALDGLDERATAQLALNLLATDRVPNELLEKIPESTEGNPLFVREFVRMLIDDGVLIRRGDGWSLSVDVDALQAPPTIQSLLSARVDRLRADERTVLELASVVGKEFYRGALHELAPANVRAQIDGCLESLRRKELVEPAGTYWIDEAVYRFHHVLIRDAAYRRLLKESRAELHERVAGWLERKTADVIGEHEEVIGYHLEQAHALKQQLGRTDEELGTRAADLLGLAAQRALDRDDLPAAASLSGRALDRLSMSPPDLLLIRCEALLAMGDVTGGATAVAEFEASAGTPRSAAWSKCFAGQLANYTAPERLLETAKSVAAAAAELSEMGDLAGAAKAHTVHAETLARLGNFGECEAALDDALTAARGCNDRRRITAVLGSAPLAQLWGPNPVSRAGGRCLDLVRLSRITTASPAVEMASKRCQAVLEGFRGRTDAAREMLRSVTRVLTELGLDHEILQTEQFMGIVELVAGDASAAREHFAISHEGFRREGVDVLAAQSAALLARAQLSLGDVEEAERLADESERLGGQDLKTSIAWRGVKAELLARRGEFDEARRLAEAAVDIASKTDALVDHGDACRVLAIVCTNAGDGDGARRAAERSRSLYEAKAASALLDAAVVDDARLAPRSSESRGLSNACLRAIVEGGGAPGFEDRISIEDRRRTLRHEYRGPIYRDDDGVTLANQVVLAMRGERLALARVLFAGSSTSGERFEIETLMVSELTEDGRIARVVFDGDDLDAALAELEQRYLSGEGADFAPVLAVVRGIVEATRLRDWEAFRAVLHDDLVFVSHRPVERVSTRGADEHVREMKAFYDLAQQLDSYVVAYHAIADNACVARVVNRGVSHEGADFDDEVLMVAQLRAGLVFRLEAFPHDGYDEAMDRFAELVRDTGPRRLENACTRSITRTSRMQATGEVPSRYSPDFIRDDRRKGLTNLEVGVGPARWSDAGIDRVRAEVLAIRGERLCLTRVTFLTDDDSPGAPEAEMLAVHEIDEDGLLARRVVFDPDDLAVAMEELDRRYVAGDGATCSPVLEVGTQLTSAVNARDWDRVHSLLAEDSTIVDHRPLSVDMLSGPDEIVRFLQQFGDVVPDNVVYGVTIDRVSPTACVARMRVQGHSADGAAVSVDYVTLIEVTEGLVRRMERFPIEQSDGALKRFEEIAAPPASLENGATRAVAAFFEALTSQDWERFRALQTHDVVFRDSRGVGDSTSGIEGVLENARSIHSLGPFSFDLSVVAVRGESLCVVNVLYGPGSGYDTPVLHRFELDERGLIRSWDSWEPERLDDALAALDARFEEVRRPHRLENACTRAALTAPHLEGTIDDKHAPGFVLEDRRRVLQATYDGPIYRQAAGIRFIEIAPIAIRDDRFALFRATLAHDEDYEIEALVLHEVDSDGRFVRRALFDTDDLDAAFDTLDEWCGESTLRLAAHRARDWDAWRAALRPDFHVVDHRPVGWGVIRGADAFVDHSKTIVELMPDVRLYVSAVYEDGSVHRVLMTGTDLHGGRTEDEYLVVLETDADGRSTKFEVFPIERFDDAVEHARAVRACGGEGNRAFRALVEGEAWAMSGDWKSVRAHICEDAVWEDRREGLKWSWVGRDAVVEQIRTAMPPGATFVETVVALRGERLSLSVQSVRMKDYEVENLVLYEIDEDGLGRTCVFFDNDDLIAATTELDERFYASEAASVVTSWSPAFRAAFTSYCARDWDAFEASWEPDARIVDHRPASSGVIEGHEDIRRYFQTLVDLVPDARMYMPEILGILDDAIFARVQVEGATQDGTWMEFPFYGITQMRNGRSWLTEVYPLDQLDAARERFAALEPTRSLPETKAIRLHRQGNKTLEDRDWDRYPSLFSERVVFEDRRRGMDLRLEGRDEVVGHVKVATPGARLRSELVAARGERLVLVRDDVTIRGDYDLELLALHEYDDDDLQVLTVLFDADDLDAAFALLEERYLAGEGAPYAGVWASIVDALGSISARDWDRYGSLLSEDAIAVDERPGLRDRRKGRREIVEWFQMLAEMSSSLVFRPITILAINERGVLCQGHSYGVDNDGAELDAEWLIVARVADGSVTRFDAFTLDQRNEAFARFAEYESAGPFDNAALRALRRAMHAFETADWDRHIELHAPDARTEDRRRGLRHEVVGREGVIAHTRTAREFGVGRLDMTPIAIRGERLALTRTVTATTDGQGFDVELLQICELAPDGLITAAVLFDADALQAALEDLDDRYVRGEGKPLAAVVEQGARLTGALNERDWVAYKRELAPDLVQVDHRPASLGEIHGREEHTRALKALCDVVPGVQFYVAAPRWLEPERGIVRVGGYGRTLDGDEIDVSWIGLYVLRDGVIARIENFGPDDMDAALARFEELRVRPAIVLENAATAAYAKQWDAYVRRDWDAAVSTLAPDVFLDDRRFGVGSRGVGVRAWLNVFKTLEDLGLSAQTYEVLATRGAGLALTRSVLTDDAGNELATLVLFELGNDGSVSRVTWFDALDEAFAELDERYAAGEGAPYADLARLHRRMTAAIHRQDWDDFLGCFAPDFVFVDHTPVGFGEMVGPPRAWAEQVSDLFQEVHVAVVSIPVITPNGGVSHVRITGRDSSGAPVEFASIDVGIMRDGLIVRREQFMPDQLDDAIARFEELTGGEQ